MTSTAARIATAQLGVGNTSAEVTDWFRQQLLAALSDPMFNTPKAFETWMVDRIAVSGLNIPIGQIVGFAGFAFQPTTTIDTVESTTSTTYVDLATVGPSLQGLSKGRYAIFFGAQGQPTSPSAGIMSLTVTNVAGASDTDSIVFSPGSNMSASRLVLKDLALDGSNGVAAQYRSSGGNSCSFEKRWLIAVKYSNL